MLSVPDAPTMEEKQRLTAAYNSLHHLSSTVKTPLRKLKGMIISGTHGLEDAFIQIGENTVGANIGDIVERHGNDGDVAAEQRYQNLMLSYVRSGQYVEAFEQICNMGRVADRLFPSQPMNPKFYQ